MKITSTTDPKEEVRNLLLALSRLSVGEGDVLASAVAHAAIADGDIALLETLTRRYETTPEARRIVERAFDLRLAIINTEVEHCLATNEARAGIRTYPLGRDRDGKRSVVIRPTWTLADLRAERNHGGRRPELAKVGKTEGVAWIAELGRLGRLSDRLAAKRIGVPERRVRMVRVLLRGAEKRRAFALDIVEAVARGDLEGEGADRVLGAPALVWPDERRDARIGAGGFAANVPGYRYCFVLCEVRLYLNKTVGRHGVSEAVAEAVIEAITTDLRPSP